MIKRRSGITTINVSGVPFYVSYIPVSGTDWTLGLAIPEQELLASVGYVKGKIDSAVKTMSTRFVILTIAFLFLMILSTTLLFHRRLLSPLKKLIVYTKKIAEGNLEQQVEVEGPGEIGELAAAFNQMARDLFKTTVSRNILSSEISEREKVEAALRESEEKLRNIIENSSNLFYSHTSENVLTFLSPQTIKFLDCEPYECMEVWMNTVTDNPLNAIGYESTQRAIDTGERQPPFELELIGKKGRKIWVEVNEQPVVVDGKTVSIVGALTDITERKKEEQRRLLMEAQLQHSQKIESVGRLAGGIAHDFNNMLSVILGNVNLLLLTSHQGDKSNDYLTEIQTAAQHSAELTQQLLAFARKQPMVPQVLDLNDAVEDTLKILKRLIGENINLIWKPAIKIWPVMLDPSQINQILANLCLNARDAIEGSGEVVIQTENVSVGEQSGKDFQKIIPGDYVLLTLTDNGCGIDEVLSEKLFEPFFTTKDVGKGTGLGLSTIYGIIKQNKGFVSIKSERGKGTSFSIYFPRCTREELKLFREEQTRMSAIVPSEPVTDGGTDLRPPKQETILLVEDEPAILKMTTMVLQMEGFTVVSASAPSTAIELVKELSIQVDLLITDVIMPEMNGLDLSKVLQSIIPGLKVLYMSGYTADVINKEVVIDEGASFIQKPFDIDELVVVIRKVLDS
jgi:PAS domain S-box-containing protein